MNSIAIKNLIKAGSKILILFAVIAIGLSSCKSDGDIVPQGKPAGLNVINVDTAALNIYQNGARLNNISSISPGSQTGYISVAAGSTIYQLKKAGAVDYLINNLPLKLDTANSYSLFIAGETADKIFLVNDTIPAVSAKTANVRFINAAPASNLNVSIGAHALTSFTFKSVAPYASFTSGDNVVTITQFNTGTQLLSKTITLQAGSTNTLYVKGIPGGTGLNTFTLVLLTNN